MRAEWFLPPKTGEVRRSAPLSSGWPGRGSEVRERLRVGEEPTNGRVIRVTRAHQEVRGPPGLRRLDAEGGRELETEAVVVSRVAEKHDHGFAQRFHDADDRFHEHGADALP